MTQSRTTPLRSWQPRPAVSTCARSRRGRAPTWCSSISRTPAHPRPRNRRAPSRSTHSPDSTGVAPCAPCVSTASTPRGATTTSSRSSPAHGTRWTSSSSRRCVRRATCGGSTCCSPSSRPSSGCSGRIALEALIEEAEGLVERRRDLAGQPPPGGTHLRRRRPVRLAAVAASTATSSPQATTPATSGTWCGCRCSPPRARRGIDAIDAPYPGYQDLDGYRRTATHASLLGFDGKWAIHPAQVPVANEVFTPTAEEIADARAIIADYREAEAGGVGAIGRDGRLVDAALMRHAENVLRKADT